MPSAERERDLSAELALALSLADAVDRITLPRFQNADFTLAWKDDLSEVTEVDREAEELLATLVASARPGDGFFGEEHGLGGDTASPYRWIVDPIDGTSGFVRGIPVWATLIALTHADDVLVAVISAPALARRWWAVRNGGAFADGRRCEVSSISGIEQAQISITLNDGWDELGLTERVIQIAKRGRRARGFGDFWQHCLVAEGALDIAIDAVGVAPYDIAATRLIVEEAGGTFTDRLGQVTHRHDTAISTNGLLHASVIDALAD